MTTVLDRVPLERISERAASARPGVVVLSVVASVLIGLGWVSCKVLAGCWLVLVWCGSAVAEGWVMARAGAEKS